MSENEDRTKVLILTERYKILGEIALIPGARLTDFVVDLKSFLAVADAEVSTHDGRAVFRASFVNVHRDHIEIIVPSEAIDA